jgi:hypothetical protein
MLRNVAPLKTRTFMAQDNLISAELSASTLAEIKAAIETIRTKLPFLVNLTMEERQA